MGNDSALGLYRYNTIENTENKRKIDGGYCFDLLASSVGPDCQWCNQIFCLFNSCPSIGAYTVKDYTFSEFADGQKILSKAKSLMFH